MRIEQIYESKKEIVLNVYVDEYKIPMLLLKKENSRLLNGRIKLLNVLVENDDKDEMIKHAEYGDCHNKNVKWYKEPQGKVKEIVEEVVKKVCEMY